MKDITGKMLSTIREGADRYKVKKVSDLIEEEVSLEKDNFLTRAKILMEEAEKKKGRRKRQSNTYNQNNSSFWRCENIARRFTC